MHLITTVAAAHSAAIMAEPASKRPRVVKDPASLKAAVTETADGEISCSIEETNRIRALLGMKPLTMEDSESKDYVAVQNMKNKREEEQKLRESAEILARIEKAKNKRLLNAKISAPAIDEDESAMSAAEWVVHSRKKQQEQSERARREAEQPPTRENAADSTYSSSDLKGLRVLHGAGDFNEGEDVILTLADSNILDVGEHGVLLGVRNEADVLHNAGMAENEHRKHRERETRRAKQPVYSGYDDEEFSESGARPALLAHYDKLEREGPRLVLGEQGAVQDVAPKGVDRSDRSAKGTAYSLGSEVVMAKDFYTPAEYASFNKPKKEKKLRKLQSRRRTEDEDDQPSSQRSGGVEAGRGVDGSNGASGGVPVEEVDDDAEIAESLARARRVALRSKQLVSREEDRGAADLINLMHRLPPSAPPVDEDADQIDADGRRKDGTLLFTSTTEFTTRLQARLNEVSRSRTEAAVRDQETRDLQLVMSEAKEQEEDAMDVEDEAEAEVKNEGAEVGFMEQPLASSGMAAALALLKSSGDLHSTGALAGRAKDFRGFDPSGEEAGVKIEYRDEFGRKLTPKEAFRQLSYRFHGQAPGKKKTEKRLKELAIQNRDLSSKGSSDAGTMKNLIRTQEATGKAHVTIQVIYPTFWIVYALPDYSRKLGA